MAFKRSGVRLPLAPPLFFLLDHDVLSLSLPAGPERSSVSFRLGVPPSVFARLCLLEHPRDGHYPMDGRGRSTARPVDWAGRLAQKICRTLKDKLRRTFLAEFGKSVCRCDGALLSES